MHWRVIFHHQFKEELRNLRNSVKDKLLKVTDMIATEGPSLGRQYVDTFNGSKFDNLKEIRFKVPDGEWRFAFIFDPRRNAVILVPGNKSGIEKRRFIRNLSLLQKRDTTNI